VCAHVHSEFKVQASSAPKCTEAHRFCSRAAAVAAAVQQPTADHFQRISVGRDVLMTIASTSPFTLKVLELPLTARERFWGAVASLC
jgi:hypothetical protein